MTNESQNTERKFEIGEQVKFSTSDITMIGKIDTIADHNGNSWLLTRVDGFNFTFPIRADKARRYTVENSNG